MPIIFDLDRAIYQWQAKHNERLTYAELAKRAGISLPTLHRIKSGELIHPDLRKINMICKVLECEPGDLFQRVVTKEQSLEDMEIENRKRSELLKQLDKVRQQDEKDGS